jgi:hypothetical protein
MAILISDAVENSRHRVRIPLSDEVLTQPVVADRVLDFGVKVLADEADKIFICQGEAAPRGLSQCSHRILMALDWCCSSAFGRPRSFEPAVRCADPRCRKLALGQSQRVRWQLAVVGKELDR